MGIHVHYLPFLDLVNEICSFKDKEMNVLGSQRMADSPEFMRHFAKTHAHDNFYRTPTVASLFKDRYGLKRYTDYDFNNSSDVKVDFGKPLDKSLFNSCDIFFDSGTAEHIFNVAQVFENMHNMVRQGGIIINITVFSWFNHGYYNFNPRLFDHIAYYNNYESLSTGVFGWEKADDFGKVTILFIKNKPTKNMKLFKESLMEVSTKRNILYLSAVKVINQKSFIKPYDVWD